MNVPSRPAPITFGRFSAANGKLISTCHVIAKNLQPATRGRKKIMFRSSQSYIDVPPHAARRRLLPAILLMTSFLMIITAVVNPGPEISKEPSDANAHTVSLESFKDSYNPKNITNIPRSQILTHAHHTRVAVDRISPLQP
jgi:hypothetical protein